MTVFKHTLPLVLALTMVMAPAFPRAEVIHTIKPGENKMTAKPMDGLRDMGSFVVTAVADPMTFVLSDKRVVHLSGIDLPVYPGETDNPFATLALQRMQGLFLGQKVTLYQTRDERKGRMNSMGQQLGHIIKRDGDKEIWAQKILVEEGLMRALPTQSNPEGADRLFEAEIIARKARKGLWGSAPWTVKNKDTVGQYVGTLQVVQGEIVSVATRNNVTYLNFGRDYKTDFTIVMDANTRRAVMRAGINPLGLTGRTVEVRGYVEERNGPSIQLGAAQLIRVIDGAPLARLAAPKEFTRKEKPAEKSDFVDNPSLPVLPIVRPPVMKETLQLQP